MKRFVEVDAARQENKTSIQGRGYAAADLQLIGIAGPANGYLAVLVLALYARYKEVGSSFAEGYLEMLSKGGSDWPHAIVAPLGVNLQDPAFWHGGLGILESMVTDAEQLAAAER